jgi:hypothetical protein
MENFLEVINQETSLTKARVQHYANALIAINEEGHVDTLTALARVEFMSQVIDAVKSKLRENATDEMYLHNEAKTGIVRLGVTFKHKETGVRYDFSNTPKWVEVKQMEDEVAEQRKTLENQLKTLSKATTILDEETGELNQLVPPIKSSKTSVEITLPK